MGKGTLAKGPDGTTHLVIEDTKERASYDIGDIRNHVIHGDTFAVLAKLPDECADLVFVDPPYFLQLPKKKLVRWNVKTAVGAVDDSWDKFSSFEEYDSFIKRLLGEVRRVMRPSATVWVISTYHSIFRIGKLMQDLGFWLLNDVIWLKTNPMPNWLGVRFTNATETLIWAARDKKAKGHSFDRKVAKQLGIGKVGANVWEIPICSGGERLKKENGEKLHSTQKPAELLRRIMLTTSKKGDLVLDPVAGSGTTGAVARSLGRDFIMIEINPVYVKGMAKRLRNGP